MIRSDLGRVFLITGVVAFVASGACGGSKGSSGTSFDTGGASTGKGSSATNGSTSNGSSGSGMGGGIVISGASGSGGSATTPCTVPCDASTQICSHGVCVPRMTTCTSDDQCENDTRCDPAQGCVPWDSQMPPDDPSCVNVSAPGVFQPKVRCEFTSAPPGDAFPSHLDVQSTPIVVNFNNPGAYGPPSIVTTFTANVPTNYTEDMGVIRVLRGTDCSLEVNLGGVDLDGDGAIDWAVSSSTLAVGDLDGDGSADIVAYGSDGSTLAFTRKSNVWKLLWKAPYPAGAPWAPCDTSAHRCSLGWAGPSIHDIDGDGKPEVIREGVVFGSDGTLKSLQPSDYGSYAQGNFSVLANLDQDPQIEMTNGAHVWKWTSTTGDGGTAGAWVDDATYVNTTQPGFVAVGNFGAYGTGIPAENPEIAVVTGSKVAIYAITGEVVMPPTAVPGMGGGGPPTIGDFDGDGLPEVAIAGYGYYTVYDIDCGPNPRPGGKCSMGTCDFVTGGVCPTSGYIAWSRQSQDFSSDVTGSSVFDFSGSGKSQAVYADECFARVYDGETGEVIFSQYHSSCTWYENPIVADVEGNFRSNLVVMSNEACAPSGSTSIPCSMLDANGVDILFAGLHCQANADCVSGVCDSGLCRCTDTSQCCSAMDTADCTEEGYLCVPPPAGTAGTGNTCRAGHPHGLQGIRVYSDANDNWVRSRTVWNQHAYAVTNVNDDGTIPATSAWLNNWDQLGLNNFRQNVPGTKNGLATGDATAGASMTYACTASGVDLQAPICNRGSDPIAAGLSVGFYVAGSKVCGGVTTTALQPGTCETVDCVWPTPPTMEAQAIDVDVIADDDMAYKECKTGNDHGTVLGVFCKPQM